MPQEVILGGARTADASVGGRSTPPNTVIIESDDNETETEAQSASAPELPEKEPQGTETGGEKEAGEGDADDGAGTDTGESFIVGGVDVTAYSAEYAEKGELSGETYKALEEKGFPRELVDAYIAGVKAQQSENAELAEKEVKAIMDGVGGEQGYNKMMQWAADNLTQQEQDAYDKAVSNPDPLIAKMVVQGLKARYDAAVGTEPKLVMGNRTAEPVVKGYADRSSMIKAMSDKRYGTDPEYTRDVERKLLASGLMRTERRK